MSAKTKTRLPARVWRFSLGGIVLVTGGLVDKHVAAAPLLFGNPGAVIANPEPVQPLKTQDQQDQPDVMDIFEPAGGEGGNPLPQIFRYGPLQLHPHASYSLTYGNGIQSTPGSQEAIIIQQLSPGIMVDIGPHWALDYTPTFQFYSSDKFKDSMNQSVSLTGGVDYEAWKFGLAHGTQITSQPMVQTGEQTDTASHSTSLNASRALNSNISTDLGLSQNITLVSGFQDSYDWNTMDWINYIFSPRLNAGLGVGGGYVLVATDGSGNGNGTGPVVTTGSAGNMDQYYEQLQARINWRASGKLSFQVSGGLENRQFLAAGAGDSLDPIFGLTIQYQLLKATQISLHANRTVASSDFYLAAQQTETTVVGVNVDQQLWRQFKLGAGLSYSRTDYSTPTSGAIGNAANRSDDVVAFNARLSHPFYRRGTWSLFYQYSDDTSSQQGFSFQSNQVGFEVSYSF